MCTFVGVGKIKLERDAWVVTDFFRQRASLWVLGKKLERNVWVLSDVV